jgi:hypothetical protein
MAAQADSIENQLFELVLYSNGGFGLDDLLSMTTNQLSRMQPILIEKIKQDRGIKQDAQL